MSPPEPLARSIVSPRLDYHAYKEELRVDFWFSCAYCAWAEWEARGISFEIDHYLPKSQRPDLIASYDNLFYCCAECNRLKGARPSPRETGYRFFRPDQDRHEDHFRIAGLRLEPVTNAVGRYTIVVLDLNRKQLLQLRELRERYHTSRKAILYGTRALLDVAIQSLPTAARERFMELREKRMAKARSITNALDAVLRREFNRSPFLDQDAEAADRASHRRELLSELGTFPKPEVIDEPATDHPE